MPQTLLVHIQFWFLWVMGVGNLSRIMLLVGVGLNSLGEPDETSSYWELIVLWEEVKLLVGLSGGAGCRS